MQVEIFIWTGRHSNIRELKEEINNWLKAMSCSSTFRIIEVTQSEMGEIAGLVGVTVMVWYKE